MKLVGLRSGNKEHSGASIRQTGTGSSTLWAGLESSICWAGQHHLGGAWVQHPLGGAWVQHVLREAWIPASTGPGLGPSISWMGLGFQHHQQITGCFVVPYSSSERDFLLLIFRCFKSLGSMEERVSEGLAEFLWGVNI